MVETGETGDSKSDVGLEMGVDSKQEKVETGETGETGETVDSKSAVSVESGSDSKQGKVETVEPPDSQRAVRVCLPNPDPQTSLSPSPSSPELDEESATRAIESRVESALREYDRSWRHSKDRELRRTLRAIALSFRGDGHPALRAEFKLGSGARATLALDRWPLVAQYEALRAALRSGFVYFITVPTRGG